jgi:aarF domain-containing kinase
VSLRCLTDGAIVACGQAALRYMVYGKQGVFDADRLIDLLNAFESFTVAAQSSRGDMDQQQLAAASSRGTEGNVASSNGRNLGGWEQAGQLLPQLPRLPLPLPSPVPEVAFGDWTVAALSPGGVGLFGLPANRFDIRQAETLDSQGRLREALR